MILNKLNIELQQWGENKGQYKGEVSFLSKQGEVMVHLSPEHINKILPIVADAMIASTKEVANLLTGQIIDQKEVIKLLDSRE